MFTAGTVLVIMSLGSMVCHRDWLHAIPVAAGLIFLLLSH